MFQLSYVNLHELLSNSDRSPNFLVPIYSHLMEAILVLNLKHSVRKQPENSFAAALGRVHLVFSVLHDADRLNTMVLFGPKARTSESIEWTHAPTLTTNMSLQTF